MVGENPGAEPLPSVSPVEPKFNLDLETLPTPVDEPIAAISLPQPIEEGDDVRDWYDSHLYHYIEKTHTKLLASRGIITQKPTTPRSQRGMSKQEKEIYNLK
jgi:hypothetical protein